jgi:hypothetical protein
MLMGVYRYNHQTNEKRSWIFNFFRKFSIVLSDDDPSGFHIPSLMVPGHCIVSSLQCIAVHCSAMQTGWGGCNDAMMQRTPWPGRRKPRIRKDFGERRFPPPKNVCGGMVPALERFGGRKEGG